MNNNEKLKLFINLQQSEAQLHWNRNNYFLMCSSILLLAYSQFDQYKFQICITLFGILLNFPWFLIQHRSSKYIKYWKDQAEEIRDSLNIVSIYPKDIGGIEIRKISYSLPILFSLVWLFLFIFLVCS